jgi:hypothetical protein
LDLSRHPNHFAQAVPQCIVLTEQSTLSLDEDGIRMFQRAD